MEYLSVIIGVIVVGAIVVLAARQWPLGDRRDDDPNAAAGESDRQTGSRPAGPGAEGMGVAEPGEIVPGVPGDQHGSGADTRW